METLDIKQFITFKTDNETLELDKNTLNLFKSIFNGIDNNRYICYQTQYDIMYVLKNIYKKMSYFCNICT
jgi:hypothetical protein